MRICRGCCGHLGQRWRKNKKPHAEELRECDQRNRAKGSRGDFVPFRLPLAGSRDGVPCGVWGNAPTAGRETNTKKAANKGAGSKVSLPVTLRVRRRAPKQVLPTTMLCRAKWARPHCLPPAHTILRKTWAPPHNSAARRPMSFPPSAACKFLDLPPVNLRNLHLHLTKNPFVSRPPHLCGVTLAQIPQI